MSTRRLPRQSARRPVSLIEPPVVEGECPSSRCRGTYVLTATGQVPEHARADSWTGGRRCPCSGWLARNPRRSYFFVEGVRFL